MKVIYIASPYTKGDIAANVSVQIEAAHRILDMGHCPVAPLLSHYLHIHRQRPYADWIEMDLALIPKTDIVLRLPGESEGADREVAKARECGIVVVFGWEELKTFLVYAALYEAEQKYYEKDTLHSRAKTPDTEGRSPRRIRNPLG